MGENDLANIERRLALLEYRFNEHNAEAENWKKRIVEVETLVHHGKALLVSMRIILIGGAFVAVAASQGIWAAITRVFKP